MRDVRRCRTASTWLTAAEDQLSLVELMGRQHLSLPTVICPSHIFNRPETRFRTSSSSAIPYIKVAHVAHLPRSFAPSQLRASMTSETPPSAFEHDPLPDSTTQFRLLHILRGDFGQHVECEISSWPIDDAPSYYAISYTWGDPAETAEITVNGKPLAVRRNCEYVLQQAFATKASRYYWVDAICIAQTSIQERNHQVGIMGKIYSGAKHVFACVGPHADDSEYLMATIDSQRPILEKVYMWGRSIVGYNMLSVHHSMYNPMSRHMRRQLQCLFTMRTSERLRTGEAFIAFMKRPYFTRVWVLQELHLATRVSYCCGVDVLPGEHFRALDSLIEYWINRHDAIHVWPKRKYQRWILQRCILDNIPLYDFWQPLCLGFFNSVPHRGCLRLSASARKPSLGEVLLMLNCFNCVDARDNLYGILSLVGWPDGQRPIPDYTKDNFEVAKHVLSLWTHGGIYTTLQYQCSLLSKLFDVTLELASFRDAIALRSSTAPQTDLGLQGNQYSEIAKVKTAWRGIQIVEGNRISEHADGRKQSDLHSCHVDQVQNGRFVLIRVGSQITVRAHVDTKVGDWCVVDERSPFSHGRYGLILRGLDDHKYVVVGSALIDSKNDTAIDKWGGENMYSSFSRFKGWLDPEDLMILVWMLDEVARKEQVSDEDIEEFLGMRVCGWKDSSYFEEVSDDEI